ncbi:synaptotagmin 4 protein, variant 2 [Daphnia pulex]|uniref:Synaptotagmin 4 protein, variant 2 n=1 Tax=Daphnia pulex TaxID=6669 RepID=E9GFT4_DAPPU|nr:synaptotagmin 4 protein, variant 2 [Daphnia pulex]|eukprot:EFX81695.1 synaptotagmin 4 protein, variant 2 [Daphnia pulex]
MKEGDGPDVEPLNHLSTPAVVGICLGGVVLLISVAAVSCFCYRGHHQQTRSTKKARSPGSHIGSENRPLAFRKPVAVKSPNNPQQLTHSYPVSGGSSVAISHHLKKSPSPTGAKTPPGSCPIGKSPSPLSGNEGPKQFLIVLLIANVCVISATTPSTLTPTYETSSPQVSRKNSLISGCSRSEINALQEEGQQRETVIRFQLENEVTHPAELMKSDLVASASANLPGGEIDLVAKMECGGGSNKLGQLYFKVRYINYMSRVLIYYSTLNITVVRCQGLPARDSNIGSSDPYVKLQLLPDKHHKVKTRVLRRTLNPVYDEDFTFYGIGENQLQSLTLHFVVLCFDRYSRDDVIGEVLLPVNEALEEMTVDSNHTADNGNHSGALLFRDIAPRSHKMRTHGRGELLVSLCYQPQASRLTAVVLKARNIPRMDMTGLADPYVKIYLVHNGQRVAKKKTHVKKRTLNPVFNESFVFDLPASATSLDNISLEFLVLDWDRVTKNEVIGRLELGGAKTIGTALHHWNEVLNSPRRQIAEWHKLKD